MATMWIQNPLRKGHFIDDGNDAGSYAHEPVASRSSRADTAASRHDAAHGRPGDWVPLPPAWNTARLMPSSPLTDAAIDKWRKRGYKFDADTPGIVTRTEAAKKAAGGNA
jgi:hypothetical protein